MAEKVIAVVGARLNSSRLPKKHFLPLAGKPMIARIFERLDAVDNLAEIVLATTSDSYNQPLTAWAEESYRKVVAFDGDVNDLMGRVDSVVKAYNADIILYVCGDCPLLEPATIDRMLSKIIGKKAVDTVALSAPVSGEKNIHEGFDVYRRSFWNKMIVAASEPFEKEHVGAVYHHLKKVTPRNVAVVEEPEVFSRIEHRISVDTPSDYQFMERVYTNWFLDNEPETLVDLSTVIKKMQETPSIGRVNKHVYQKNIFDASLNVAIVTEAGPNVGLGHLMRMLVATSALQDHLGAKVTLFIQGVEFKHPELALIPHVWVGEFNSAMLTGLADDNDVCVFDVKDVSVLRAANQALSQASCCFVGVDANHEDIPFFDLVWMPAFYDTWSAAVNEKVYGGWDCYLLRDGGHWEPHSQRSAKRLLVLTGGGDAAGLGKYLPDLLMGTLPNTVAVDWVRGPYASNPDIANINKGRQFTVLDAPENLPDLFVHYDAVLCVYGVSYFECLQAGVPTVVFDAVGASQAAEWHSLKEQFTSTVADSVEEAIHMVTFLLTGQNALEGQARVAHSLRKGPELFAKTVLNCVTKKPEGSMGKCSL